jgi:branched-chain amino acid transport system substrate-binding protein
MMKRLGAVIAVLFVVVLLMSMVVVQGCGSSSEVSTSSSDTTVPTSDDTTATTAGGTTGKPKVIKIGVSAALGYPAGLGASKCAQVLADMDNANGGVKIGDDTYTVEVVVYDSQFTPDVAISNINRLIFEDDVKYIVSDPIVVDPWLPTAEENKVLVCAASSTDPILSPDVKYGFQTGLVNSNAPVALAWFAHKFPDKKVLMFASPDSMAGHAYADLWQKAWEAFGGTFEAVYYPQSSQDYSALATQIKTADPDVFSTLGGFNDQAVFKSVAESGYKGTVLSLVPLVALKTVIPMEEMEGWYVKEQPTQFETPTDPFAIKFREAYTAKYGSWDFPTSIFASGYSAIIAAMQKAGSIEVDAVAAALGSGLTFDSTEGQILMIARPDKGNTRTVDSVNSAIMCQITSGEEVVLETVPLEQCAEWMGQVFGE